MYMSRRPKTEIPYELLGRIAAIILFMVALFFVVLFILPERTAAAGDSSTTYRITSVQIEEGDSLWSLASEYYSEEFVSVTDYIGEIKRMNGLTSDTLYAGNYILIPCYTVE